MSNSPAGDFAARSQRFLISFLLGLQIGIRAGVSLGVAAAYAVASVVSLVVWVLTRVGESVLQVAEVHLSCSVPPFAPGS